jgi:hypothetical protein
LKYDEIDAGEMNEGESIVSEWAKESDVEEISKEQSKVSIPLH